MLPSRSILRQVVVSFVLILLLQCASAMRFTSKRYAAPSIRRFTYPWKYFPYAHSMMPRSMQRRFMWKEMDDTVDEFMDGVASGARVMKQMFAPSMLRYRKPIEYDPQPTKVKYIIKKPSSPFKHLKVIKFRAPKKALPIYNSPLVQLPPVVPPTPPRPNLLIPFMTEHELRQIEKEQEKRVEGKNFDDFHEHSHQSHVDDDVVTGKINEFGEGWLPIQAPFSTPKPFAVSMLHTSIEGGTTPAPTTVTYQPTKKSHSYEVTEHNAEESMKKEQAFKPTNHFDFLTSTTESPNYPDYFLKTIQPNDYFKPKRVHTTSTTPLSTVSFPSSSSTMSNRLPPRSTTERPFKRYNLHRPKSSKLFFSHPSSSVETIRFTQTTTQSSVVISPEVLTVVHDPIRTTRETIKTTREPIRTTSTTTTTTTTTREPPKTSTPKIVRTTRNDSHTTSKVRIKNSTLNEGLKKILNKHRGSVKFGEKQR